MSCPRLSLGLLIFIAAAALVLPEAEAGFITPPTTLRASPPEAQSYFGYAVASGDVNGDGYDDVIVGSPSADVSGHPDSGEVRVFLSPSLSSVSVLHAPDVEDGAQFGRSVATGDVNGDGFTDVVVGAPNSHVGSYSAAGKVFVFLGPSLTSVSTIDNAAAENSAYFGRAVAVGDVNNDGKDDVLVGAPEASAGGMTRAGKAFVFLGPSFTTVSTLQDPEPEDSAHFGRSLAAGDVNGDGRDEVIVGAPDSDMGATGQFLDAGQAFVFAGPSFASASSLQDPEPQNGAFFGWSVAAGDTNNDGYDEVIVGAYGSNFASSATAGQVFVFSGPSLAESAMLHDPDPELDGYFGFAVTAGDVNGDGYEDAVIGADDKDSADLVYTSAGEAFIFLAPSFETVIPLVDPVVESFAFFARSVAVGDVNNDGKGDFVAGGPWSDVGSATDAGETFVFLAEPDADGDGVTDSSDNCPTVYNPDQTNTDAAPIDNGPVVAGDDVTVPNGDSLGDACDDDDDNDRLSDADEASAGTDPHNRDTDGDRVIDGAELLLGSNPLDPGSKPSCVGITDADHDCLAASVEAIFGSSDNKRDTDGDGISDGVEVKGWGTSPTVRNSDGDRCDDDKEIAEINGDGVVNALDEARVALRIYNVQDDDPNDGNPIPDLDMQVSPAFDINKDGVMNALDPALVALNSSMVEPANECDCR
jgi:hypothetical protein